jgi:AcrR family transcriptional regulator
MTAEPRRTPRTTRARMTATQRRAQLLDVSRRLFAEKGFEGTSVEEIAARAEVSKPVVYEHFGGKEGIYAVVIDREIQALTSALTGALDGGGHPKVLVERSALALLGYIEESEDGFRILVRDSPVAQATGTFSSLIGDVATQVEHLLANEFKRRHLDPRTAPIYAQMLVGMVALTGQYWLDARSPKKADVAAALVNLAWNGLSGLERRPQLTTAPEPRKRAAKPRPKPGDAQPGDAAAEPGPTAPVE